MSKILSGVALCVSLVVGSAATATTVTFDTFASTNPDPLSPTVTINDSVANQFAVTIALGAGDVGTLGGVFFDVAAPTTSVNGTTYLAVAPTAAALSVSNFTYHTDANGFTAHGISTGLCSNNTNLNGFGGSLPLFEIAVCYRSTGNPNGRPTNGLTSVSFIISDATGLLTLDQFQGVGLRYQQASTRSGSDKLFGVLPPSPVPLPAGGFLLLGALGALSARRRRATA
ncbi:VPLPA-CTERM sorting domain-containing protein [Rhodobacteraceae bacterium N5(2021)]|uniref:VPLPA-CTERM sorting domain-containing protein n=1 Tax=Gymnodinialimonas phycosphaerae TaxID=2841589 RepID=A0A975YGH7_9RHOB|nr:VPLPA-CTERM sorting domain-containing protein [Gymnodinialimonas phycosphaerae]MBY4891711.1 VPLPA-CTERM sorting domain-containing protein [Gymnodinialimonas phycosphaerae]